MLKTLFSLLSSVGVFAAFSVNPSVGIQNAPYASEKCVGGTSVSKQITDTTGNISGGQMMDNDGYDNGDGVENATKAVNIRFYFVGFVAQPEVEYYQVSSGVFSTRMSYFVTDEVHDGYIDLRLYGTLNNPSANVAVYTLKAEFYFVGIPLSEANPFFLKNILVLSTGYPLIGGVNFKEINGWNEGQGKMTCDVYTKQISGSSDFDDISNHVFSDNDVVSSVCFSGYAFQNYGKSNYDRGYADGANAVSSSAYANGYSVGYSEGYVVGQHNPTQLDLFEKAFSVVGTALNFPVMGVVTLGWIIGGFFALLIVKWILGWFI